MASYVQIANLAATEIGTDARITDPKEDKVLARAVAGVWDIQRQAAIRDGSWNFATRRKELAALADGVGYPFSHVYQLPDGCLRLLEVLNIGARQDYQLEGGRILCNVAGPLYIRYLVDVTEPGDFDQAFAECFAKRIAWTIGRKIAGSAFDEAAAERKYFAALQASRRVDAMENPPIGQEESGWIEARLGGLVHDPLRMG